MIMICVGDGLFSFLQNVIGSKKNYYQKVTLCL